jgi:hypothetical protein
LPSNPDRKIPGMVRFAKSDIVLDLLGSLVKVELLPLGKVGPPFKTSTILGSSHSGKKLTLHLTTDFGGMAESGRMAGPRGKRW